MRRNLVSMAMMTLCAVLAMFFAADITNAVWAQECRVVKIQQDTASGKGGAVTLDPEKLTVKKGTCVIWVNWVQGARVSFQEDGKSCNDASGPAAGFYAAENCYLTDFLEFGGTSSLFFNQAGTFNYAIEMPDPKEKTAGEVAPGVAAVKGIVVVE